MTAVRTPRPGGTVASGPAAGSGGNPERDAFNGERIGTDPTAVSLPRDTGVGSCPCCAGLTEAAWTDLCDLCVEGWLAGQAPHGCEREAS